MTHELIVDSFAGGGGASTGIPPRLRVLSLGAGVQSTTLALMAAHGEIEAPDCAIFADTGSEPNSVYRHLDWLEGQLPFPVHRVSVGNLGEQIRAAMAGDGTRMDARPPFFTGGGGQLRRQCTGDFKIAPIHKKVRELLGLQPRQRGPKEPIVEQWIGISLDEVFRMKPSRVRWIRHRWPLIERRMTRSDCLRWSELRQLPKPPKSACTFCPYRSAAEWRAMRDNDPPAFSDACEVDRIIRPGMPGPNRPRGEAWFVHRSLTPLDEVDFSTAEDRGQGNLFLNECEGMCGV